MPSQKAFRDDCGRPHAGLLTGQDLAEWQANYDAPAAARVGDWEVVKCGAWSQRPVFLQQLLMLDAARDQLAYVDGVPTAHTVHLVTECAKLAFADREAWYGDSPDVPLTGLLSRKYAATRIKLVTDEASDELRPGEPGNRPAVLPGVVLENRGLAPGGPTGEPVVLPTGVTRGDTVHISVVDAAGNMVSATPSGGWLQSSPAIEELCFCLDTRGQMFWLEQGLPNSFEPQK